MFLMTSIFVDFSAGTAVAKTIINLLPSHTVLISTSDVVGNKPYLRLGASLSDAAKLLQEAWENAATSSISIHGSKTISLADISKHSATGEPLTAVDWTVPNVPIRVRPVDECKIFRSDRTYLLIGLSGEVGQSLAVWMVEHGACHIVLTSRKPSIDPEFIASLEKKGADVRAMPLDITSRDSLNKCLRLISHSMPEISGIVNGALVVNDMRFDTMSLQDMNKVLAARVDGSKLLDDVFHDTPLDFFIMISSLTTYLGNKGQSNYAASNMFMSTLAQQRRRRGFAASVIELSSLMGIGHVRIANTFDAAYFRSLGATNVSETDLHAMFAEAINVGSPESQENPEIITGMSTLYHDELDNLKADYRRDIKLSQIILTRPGGQASDDNSVIILVKAQLKSAKSVAHVHNLLLDSFIKRVKKVLQIPNDDIVNGNETLVERGVDSLVALDIRSWFVRELDVDMPVLKILGGNSIADLIKESMKKLSGSIVDINALPATSEDDEEFINQTPILTVEECPPDDQPTEPSPKPTSTLRGQPLLRDVFHLQSGAPSTVGTGMNTPALSESDFEPGSAESTRSSDSSVDEESSWRDEIINASQEIKTPMSFGQTRFWFLHHALEDKTTFNVAICIRLVGKVKANLLDKALQAVARKHEAIRTRYFWSGHNMDEPTQGILSQSLVRLEQRQITSKSEVDKALEELRDWEWDLSDSEAIKFILLTLSEDEHWLVFGCHHITLDGIGINIIFADLEKAYQGKSLIPIPEKSQYRTYSIQQRHAHENGEFRDAIDFFRKIIPSDVIPIHLLPFATTSTRKSQESYR